MSFLTRKQADLISFFDKIDETQDGIKGSSSIKILIDKIEQVANRVMVKGDLPLELIVGFYKTLSKIIKNLVFLLNLKTVDLQDLIYTTIGVDNNITTEKLYPYTDNFSRCRNLSDVYCYRNNTHFKDTEMELKLTEYKKLTSKRVYLMSYFDIFFRRCIVLDETAVDN